MRQEEIMKFLTNRLAAVKAENEKPQNCLEPVETKMIKIKDLVFQQFNTRPPSIARDGHETLVKISKSSTWPCGRSNAKRCKGSYSTRIELEVELNATTGKNEVLTDCLAAIEAENEKLQNCMELVDSGMMKIKDLFFQQFNTLPPSIARDGHVTPDTGRCCILIPNLGVVLLVPKTQNEPSFLQMFRETHEKGTEFATPEIAQKYVGDKVFKSKSQILGLEGRVRPKDVRDRTLLELSLKLN
ncbi:LOW QUALITY PROTEIN: hypothetical protein Cgig2_004326 [Carnegiea gigantea]|uniref:Uncharacterized protein n=1 Tax=Carnegiea gigantea TaxID=171969 RepID=A0A9Q1JYC8_9CARY|nr:LOW QUALITY PROTEIN: hypothetical protein Cgig2_004326 [Carnegiea gigantea]